MVCRPAQTVRFKPWIYNTTVLKPRFAWHFEVVGKQSKDSIQEFIVALGLEDKKAIVADVQLAAQSALSAVVADSRGVTVGKMTELRQLARDNGVWLKVVRNTLARRAVEGTAYACLADTFVGPTIIAFSNEHPGAGARILRDFAKGNDKFELKAAAFEGNMVDIAMLASLPTYDEAIARLMSCMKEAAAGKLVRTIAAVREQKEQEAA
jgi:large subunit ribosomal protein L10